MIFVFAKKYSIIFFVKTHTHTLFFKVELQTYLVAVYGKFKLAKTCLKHDHLKMPLTRHKLLHDLLKRA